MEKKNIKIIEMNLLFYYITLPVPTPIPTIPTSTMFYNISNVLLLMFTNILQMSTYIPLKPTLVDVM